MTSLVSAQTCSSTTAAVAAEADILKEERVRGHHGRGAYLKRHSATAQQSCTVCVPGVLDYCQFVRAAVHRPSLLTAVKQGCYYYRAQQACVFTTVALITPFFAKARGRGHTALTLSLAPTTTQRRLCFSIRGRNTTAAAPAGDPAVGELSSRVFNLLLLCSCVGRGFTACTDVTSS